MVIDTTKSLGMSILTLKEISDSRKYYAIMCANEVLYKTRISDTPIEKMKRYFSRCNFLTVGDIKNKLFTDKVWESMEGA